MKKIILVLFLSIISTAVWSFGLSGIQTEAIKAAKADLLEDEVLVVLTIGSGRGGFTTSTDVITYPITSRQSGGAPPEPSDFNDDLNQLGQPANGADVTFSGSTNGFTFSFRFGFIGDGTGAFGGGNWRLRNSEVAEEEDGGTGGDPNPSIDP